MLIAYRLSLTRSLILPNQLFAKKSIDKLISDSENPETRLKKTLGPLALTALGIGAVIGAGIFTVIGTAISGQKFDTSSIYNAPLLDFLIHHTASTGRPGAGPALALSLMLVALVCAFTALCYAELASMIPIAGSAYTYTYATMGELIAWIIGWDLILEYAVSNMAVSVGFAQHLVNLLDWFGWHPALKWISPAYLPGGMSDLQGNQLFQPGWHFGFNWPAFLIVMILTVVLVRGIRESAETNNIMVLLKIIAILAFIFAGAAWIHPANWHPFIPNGWPGVLTGGSIIFFTYIGFDSVSTAAEEAKNPQRDLPIGIIATLVVCTVLYIAVAVVLTGMVPWQTLLDDAAPVVNALKRISDATGSHSLHWIRLVVLFGAMMGMISSLLVFQLGQARVWFAMSRDGLLPKLFCDVHPRFRTPWRSNLLFMFATGLLAAFAPIRILGEATSIGTLFAFVLVCGGIIIMRRTYPDLPRPFRTPFVPVVPILGIGFNLFLIYGLGWTNWARLFGWMAIGLIIYFMYSRKHSITHNS